MAFTHVQGIAAHGTISGANTATLTFAAAVGSGNWVGGGGIAVPNGITISSVTDDKGNTYTVKDSLDDAGDSIKWFDFSLGNITNAPITITVTFGSGSGNPFVLIADEYSGASAVTDPTDGHAIVQRNGPGAGTDAITSSSITTTAAGDLIYSICFDTGSTPAPTAGTGFNSQASDTGGQNAVRSEDKTQSTAGSVNATFTSANGGDNFGVIIIAVKPKAGGGGININKTNFKVDKFRTPQRILGPNAGTFQVRAFPAVAITVNPGFGNLTLTGFPPLLTTVVAIDGRALRQQNFRVDKFRTPQRVLGPNAGTFPVRAFPTAVSVLPGFGSLTITGPPPSLAARVFPGFASIVLTGKAPSLALVDHPGFASIVLTGFAPAANQTSGQTVLPGLGQLTLTGPAPSLAETVFPGFGAITLTGRAPSLAVAVHPGFGQLVLSGFAPITRPLAGAAGVHLSGFAPTVSQAGGGAAQFQQITSLGGILNPGSNAIG